MKVSSATVGILCERACHDRSDVCIETTEPSDFRNSFLVRFYVRGTVISSLPVHLVVKYHAKNCCCTHGVRCTVSEEGPAGQWRGLWGTAGVRDLG